MIGVIARLLGLHGKEKYASPELTEMERQAHHQVAGVKQSVIGMVWWSGREASRGEAVHRQAREAAATSDEADAILRDKPTISAAQQAVDIARRFDRGS